MHGWRAVALLVVITVCGTSQAREEWQGNLSENFFQAFIEIYKKDPGALTRYPGGLQNIGSDQLHRAIMALDTTHFTYMYPVSVRGYDIRVDENIPHERLSLMAVKGDKMIPIPFQIDEYDRSGLIWIEGYNKAKPEGEPGVFDDFDELVFMFRDAGIKYQPEHGDVEGRILREIRLDSPRNDPRYAYLMLDNPARSEADYVNVDLDKGRVDSTVLELDFDPKDFTNFNHVAPKAGPRHGQNVFDNIYVKISTGILNQNLRVGLNSRDNIKVTPIAKREGPVRASMLVKARIWYWHLPTFFSQQFAINFHEQSVTIPSRFAIDSMRTLKYFIMFLREPRIEVNIDFHNLNGAQVTYDSVYQSEQDMGFVDGKMSEFENRLNSTRLPGDWLFMDSNQGWQMFFSNHLPVVEGGLFDAFLDGMEMNMVYADNADDISDHERFPGAMPRIGFDSTGLPRPAIKLMGAIPKLDYRNMSSLGEALLALARPENADKFRDYDELVGEVLTRAVAHGRFTSSEALADAFLADLNRMRFTGIAREDLNGLIRDAIIEVVEEPVFIDHSKVLQTMVRLAGERDIDLGNLRYATMDNTLWFPDWVGPGGPRDFYWQSVNTPRHTVRPWVDNGR